MTITLTDTIKQTDSRLSSQELDKKYTVKQLIAILPQVGITELMAAGKAQSYYPYRQGPVKLRPLSYSNKPELIRAYQDAIGTILTPESDRPTKNVRRRWTIELQGRGCGGQTETVKVEPDGASIKFDNGSYKFTTTIEDLKALIALVEEEDND